MNCKETSLVSGFLNLVRRGPCPVCEAPIEVTMGATVHLLCPSCGEYLETVQKKTKLRRMAQSSTTPWPIFAAPTPWSDIESPVGETASFFKTWDDLPGDLTEWALTRKPSVRVLDAEWPEGCCACGKPAVRKTATTSKFTFRPPEQMIGVRRDQATLIAKGIPHCAEHKDSAYFDVVRFDVKNEPSRVGLRFRSYAYQIEFRRLNPWKWR